MSDRRGTVLMGVPTFYTRLLDEPGLDPRGLRGHAAFHLGLGAVAGGNPSRLARKTGFAILERYGMTETNMNTSNPYVGERIAGTVGLPLPGVELRIADPETGAALRKVKSA